MGLVLASVNPSLLHDILKPMGHCTWSPAFEKLDRRDQKFVLPAPDRVCQLHIFSDTADSIEFNVGCELAERQFEWRCSIARCLNPESFTPIDVSTISTFQVASYLG